MGERMRNGLVGCGIVAAVLYVTMTLFVGRLWDGYSAASQMISELSAIDAPTRPLWMSLGTIYSVLMISFGFGVWATSPRRRVLRVLGLALIIHGVFGAYWPPMHQRAALAAGGATLTDTLHIVWAIVTALLFIVEAALGAAAFGKRFRVYSIVTIVIAFACGAVTGTYTSAIQANLPTPTAGTWERISAGAYMLWIAVLAIAVLRSPTGAAMSGGRNARAFTVAPKTSERERPSAA